MARCAGPIRRRTTVSAARTTSCWASSRPSAECLKRPPLLDTPDAALNQAFAWAVQRDPAGVRADPGPGLPEWNESDFEELLDRAHQFRRVGAKALPEPGSLLRQVVAGLFGFHSDGAGGRFELAPWLPPGWRSLALRRVRCHRTLLSAEVRPRSEWATVRLELNFGPPIALALGLRHVGAIERVTVDEIALEGPRAIFTLQGQHEVVFFFRGAG